MKLVTFLNHVTTHIAVRTYWRLSISSLIAIFECMTLCVTMWTVRPFFPLVCEISLSCVKRGMEKLTGQCHRLTRRSVVGELVVLLLLLDH